MVKKVQVSFSDKQAELLEHFKGELGESDADIVRNIVIAWLAEKVLLPRSLNIDYQRHTVLQIQR